MKLIPLKSAIGALSVSLFVAGCVDGAPNDDDDAATTRAELGGDLDVEVLEAGEADGALAEAGALDRENVETQSSAIVGNAVASDIFNWRFYLNTNADLLQAGIVTEAGAQSHWQMHGIAECRRAHPLFHTRQYLDRYADLSAAFGNDCTAALQHYISYGRSEGRGGLNGATFGGRSTVKNDIITVGMSTRTAGAVDSLYWNGREFINSWDHGRQLQVAWSANGWGECYNPTEAGGVYDGLKATSTSLLAAFSASGNTLATSSHPAFWLVAGEPSEQACGGTRNTAALSTYTLHKNVQVGFGGVHNAVQFLTQVDVPESLASMTIEAPTGYLGGEFSSFYTWNPSTCALAPLSADPGEQALPVVLATADGSAAMGAWSPDLPNSSYPGAGYGRGFFPDASNPANATMKWNVVFRRGATSPGSYYYRSYLAVGTLEDVRVALCQIRSAV